MNPKRILLADDEPNMALVLKLQLQRAGYEVSMAHDGREALDAILTQAPDALVTDVWMPRMTGAQLCAEIEKEVPARSFPIFVMTSDTDREHRRWSGTMHDTVFLEKPVSARVLIARLGCFFAERSGAAERSDA